MQFASPRTAASVGTAGHFACGTVGIPFRCTRSMNFKNGSRRFDCQNDSLQFVLISSWICAIGRFPAVFPNCASSAFAPVGKKAAFLLRNWGATSEISVFHHVCHFGRSCAIGGKPESFVRFSCTIGENAADLHFFRSGACRLDLHPTTLQRTMQGTPRSTANSGRRCCHSGRRLLEFRFPPAATRFAGTAFARLRGVRFHCAQSLAC